MKRKLTQADVEAAVRDMATFAGHCVWVFDSSSPGIVRTAETYTASSDAIRRTDALNDLGVVAACGRGTLDDTCERCEGKVGPGGAGPWCARCVSAAIGGVTVAVESDSRLN